jgi:hypothetical protein
VVGGLSLASSTHGRAQFNVVGDAAANLNVSVPASLVMTAGGNTLVATLLSTTNGNVTLSGVVGSANTLTLGVGGSIAITTGTASGQYTGTFVVSVNYN